MATKLERILEPEVMDTYVDAADYAGMDHGEPNRAFVDRLTSLGAAGQMLDLGTGPGDVPLLVAERFPGAHILGIDLSKNMLHFAHDKAAAADTAVAQRVTFQIADVKNLPFEDACFDVVFSNTILHHIPQPASMLREAWRVLKPGGVVLIRDLYRPANEDDLDALVNKHTQGDTDAQRDMFRDSLHAALTPDELRQLASEIGMSGCEVVVDTDRHMSLQMESCR